MSLFGAATIGATGATLKWTAPSGTTPTGYKITPFTAGALPNGVTSYLPGPSFYAAKTSASLPPLQAGKTYVFLITAILDGAANLETQPNRSALPTASVSIVSAPITINNSQ
jgi:fibronectin type III domain protein